MIEKIIKLILEKNRPLTAREISMYLNIDKSNVNRILYIYRNILLIMNNNYQWSVIPQNDISIKSDDIHFYIFKSNFIMIENYVKKLYSIDSNLFIVSSEYYHSNDDLQNLIVELEIYLICSIINTTSKSPALINEQYITKLLVSLKPVLSYVYSSSSILNFYINKFKILNSFIENLLKSIIYYDDTNETRKSYIFLKEIDNILYYYIKSIQNSEEFMDFNKSNQINVLKEFISDNYDYTEGNTNFMHICTSCGEIIDSYSGDYIDDDFYCDDCYEEHEDDVFIQEASEIEIDEDFDIDNETDKYSDNEDIIDESPLKQIIIEDCTTCLFSKNKTCKKAYLNQICLLYKYFK
jgi:hypothetical protein